MRTCIAITFLAIALIASVPSARAANIVFDDHFESYTAVAGAPGDDGDNDPTNPGDGNANDWSVIENQSDMFQVAQGASTDGWGSNQQLLHVESVYNDPDGDYFKVTRQFDTIDGTGPNPLLRAQAKVRFSEIGNDVNSTFQFYIGPAGLAANGVRVKMLPGNSTGGTAGGFTMEKGFGASDRVKVVPDILEGDWYLLEIQADPSSGEWTLSVENLDSTAPDQSGTGTLNDFAGNIGAGFQELQLTPGNGDDRNLNLDLDDIRISAVPEPTTLGLLTLGAVLIGKRRGR